MLIIDVLDALCLKDDDLLDTFKGKDLVLIINKTDILPENFNDRKIDRIFSKILFDLNRKYSNIKAAILTNKFERQFNEQFLNLLVDLNATNVIFAGRANAGKSSLINKLIHSSDLKIDGNITYLPIYMVGMLGAELAGDNRFGV